MTVRLSDVLSVDTVLLRESWDGLDAMIGAVVDTLAAADRLPRELVPEAVRVLCEREAISSTAMVEIGVSIPHARFAGTSRIVAALAACPGGVYQHGHGLPIEIVVLVLSSPAMINEHLGFLAALSELLQSERTRAAIVGATSPQQVLALIAEQERGRARPPL